MSLETLPKPLKMQGSLVFKNIVLIDLQNNELTELDSFFCQNLPSLVHLDLRNNKLKVLSEHIKALMNLQVLRLDNN